jgi:membrane protease YdiL (CAAX protease family)
VYPLAGGTLAQRRAIAVAELILCSSVPTQVLLQAILVGLGWRPVTTGGGFSLSFVVTMSLLDTVLLIALMVILTRAHGESLSALWLGRRVVWKEVLLGLSLVPPIFVMVVIILNTVRLFAPVLHNVETNPLEQMATGGLINAAAFGVLGILAGGVREELQRAFMLHRFDQYLGGAAVGVLVLSVAFGLGHIVQGWDAVITTGTLGAVWASMYLRRRSSIAPVASHAGFNSLEILRVAVVGQ